MANGQVEVTNRTLLGIIKKRLDSSKGLWPEELPSILWAYHAMVRTLIGETPFSLAFGTEIVIPVKIGMTAHRVTNFDSKKDKEGLRINLDLLTEKRDEVAFWTAAYKQKFVKYYNS